MNLDVDVDVDVELDIVVKVGSARIISYGIRLELELRYCKYTNILQTHSFI